ncbi:NnrS family protein [Croceicoccus sp. F390]|uniref:NnrS family protein n=1 Tax=Croceicoccus esteveae TaxID=3075597 RepID=A0ABU2ZKF7_9SPHN|nr:NnrS family protein [Croceicoccus sp. F390]MDT0576059.1 NnrS family protein [Croceicoccus sp. F390]
MAKVLQMNDPRPSGPLTRPQLPFLRGAFRPFFLFAALWAAAAVIIWVMAYSGVPVFSQAVDPLAWHQHEMLFGFVGAAVIGFMLTAIANWTGRPLLGGAPLAILVLLWIAVRVTLAASLGSPWLSLILELTLFFAVAAFAAREVVLSANRNLPVAIIVALFGVAAAIDLAEGGGILPDRDFGLRLGLALAVLVIGLIGGRIIPVFTRNWLAREKAGGSMPVMPNAADMRVLGLTVVALLGWLAWPSSPVVGWLFLAAALAHLWRLSRWRGWRTFTDPLVVVLHLAYLWLPLGLGLLGLHLAFEAVARSAAIHALTAGAMGLIILAVMSRASLGHTGRPLKAGLGLTLAYLLVFAGAVVRVLTAVERLEGIWSIHLSATLWAGGFALFVLLYFPILTRPRLDDPAL